MINDSSGLYALFYPLRFQPEIPPLSRLERRFGSDRWLKSPPAGSYESGDQDNPAEETAALTDEWRLKLKSINGMEWRLVTIEDGDWARWREFNVSYEG